MRTSILATIYAQERQNLSKSDFDKRTEERIELEMLELNKKQAKFDNEKDKPVYKYSYPDLMKNEDTRDCYRYCRTETFGKGERSLNRY